MSFKKIDPKKLDIKDVYHLLISGVSPRPIAWVGTVDKKGNHNLAPFSFFNAFGANPPIVGFSPAISGRTGLPKDSLLNVKDLGTNKDRQYIVAETVLVRELSKINKITPYDFTTTNLTFNCLTFTF